eukprot:CAMPEP_0182928850 /NCGR_PEP_ID=MMETSP0105_2-20130417/17851_1 /TAXON_ID=81532 ORGANISM="Acanthoeca-like sp., Strain 10tr" /NCGR_SAMPLE_ID=MMETSP0105_2 /ASSEMBLY_ACC=CAM_ASM_000205 /LENGTH=43 /DNA_ID= /DNA_START= /DNA_END= /DNA_ORIENTATION=
MVSLAGEDTNSNKRLRMRNLELDGQSAPDEMPETDTAVPSAIG